MKKRLLTLCLSVLAAVGLMAEGDNTALKVSLTDGKSIVLWLGSQPSISHQYDETQGTYLVTIVSEETTVTYRVDEIVKAEFCETPTSIEEVTQMAEESFTFRSGNTAHLRGINGKVSVFSIDGKKVAASITAAGNDGADVDLSALPNGTYIISVSNGRTFKVLKR